MNNIIFISDIHFQHLNVNVKDFLPKYKNIINDALEFGLIDNNSKLVDLYIPGDIFNYIEFGNNIKKIYRKNNIIALDFYFSVIKDFIYSKGFTLNKAVYIKGNHEFYNNFPKKEFNFMNNQDNIIDNLIKRSFEVIFNKSIVNLENQGPLEDGKKVIIGNMMYTSGINLEDLLNKNIALNFLGNNIFKRLNDCNHLSKIFDRGIENYIIDNNGELEKVFKYDKFDDFKKTLNNQSKIILENLESSMKNITEHGTGIYLKSFGLMSIFIFSFNLIKLLLDIYKISLSISNNTKTIDIITHHPLVILGNSMYGKIEDVNIIEQSYKPKSNNSDDLNNAYEIHGDFLVIIINYVKDLLKNIESVNIFGGHNHDPVIYKNKLVEKSFGNIKNLNFYNNSIGVIKLKK